MARVTGRGLEEAVRKRKKAIAKAKAKGGSPVLPDKALQAAARERKRKIAQAKAKRTSTTSVASAKRRR
jgi:hypothetical protein